MLEGAAFSWAQAAGENAILAQRVWASYGLKSWPQTRAQVRSFPAAQLGFVQLAGTPS